MNEKQKEELQLALKLIGIDCDIKAALMIHDVVDIYNLKRGRFAVSDAAEIIAKHS